MSTVDPENYSVSNLKLENSIIELNKPLTFSASVNNFSDNPINNFSTSLFINDERVAQQNITLPSNETKIIEFETNLKETGLIEARLELEEDNILEDNIAYYNFKVPEKINVLLVYDDISEINFLEAALKPATSSDRIKVTLKSINAIQFVKIEDFDMVFLVTSGNIAMPQLANYVKDGGSLVFFPSNNVEIYRINNLLNLMDLPKIDKIIQTNETELNFAEFDKIDFAHPIFKNLFSNSNKQQVESPNIFRYVKYFPSLTVKSIIQLNDKSIFLGEKNFDNGKILFFNISPDLNSGNFPLKGIFAPLITKSVFYLSSNQNENKNYIVGETIPISFGNNTFPILDVIFPGGSEKLNLQNLPTNVLEYNNDKIAGSYKFLDNNNLIDFAAVNIDPSESILERLTDDQLTKYYTDLVGDNYLMLNPKEDFLQKITKARYGTELWKLFLLLAFLLALIEMFISRSAKKDLMNLGQN
ncbi:MAG: hypothetical protein H6613_15175 [Ignavibacteriales bacterium]|nr:hypothetical protein [Ignavibacteriales bacterium]